MKKKIVLVLGLAIGISGFTQAAKPDCSAALSACMQGNSSGCAYHAVHCEPG